MHERDRGEECDFHVEVLLSIIVFPNRDIKMGEGAINRSNGDLIDLLH